MTGHFHGETILAFPAPETIEVFTMSGKVLGMRAELKGKTLTPIQANGGTPTVWFEYGNSLSFGLETAHEEHSEGIPERYVFTHQTIELTPDQPYWFRAAATDGTNTVYGQPLRITATTPAPGLVTVVGIVTSLIHRYSRGTYTLEIGLGDFNLDEREGFDPRTWQNAPPEIKTNDLENGS